MRQPFRYRVFTIGTGQTVAVFAKYSDASNAATAWNRSIQDMTPWGDRIARDVESISAIHRDYRHAR